MAVGIDDLPDTVIQLVTQHIEFLDRCASSRCMQKLVSCQTVSDLPQRRDAESMSQHPITRDDHPAINAASSICHAAIRSPILIWTLTDLTRGVVTAGVCATLCLQGTAEHCTGLQEGRFAADQQAMGAGAERIQPRMAGRSSPKLSGQCWDDRSRRVRPRC